LECTPDHLIKTTDGWQEVGKLKLNSQIYLHKNSTGKPTVYTMANGTIHEAQNACTLQYGNAITAKHQKATMYTIKTETQPITISVISNVLKAQSTCQSMHKDTAGLKQKKAGSIPTISGHLLKLGMRLKKVASGIVSMLKNHLFTKSLPIHASNAERFIPIEQATPKGNTAITTAKLKHLEIEGKKQEFVYDLAVADCHEYFANGILVHNCIDSIRYIALNKFAVSNKIKSNKAHGAF